MRAKQLLITTGRLALLLLLFYVFFIIGSLAISGRIPDTESEPGILDPTTGFLFFGLINTLLIIRLIKSSRWSGWKLALALAFAYFGAVTILTQIEAWYFMSNITFDQNLLPYLLLMGLPIAFVYIPLAVWILGKGKKREPYYSIHFYNKVSSPTMVLEIRRYRHSLYYSLLECGVFYSMAKCGLTRILWKPGSHNSFLGAYSQHSSCRS